MVRTWFAGILGFALVGGGILSAAGDEPPVTVTVDLEKLKGNPDDVAGWQAYLQTQFSEIAQDLVENPDVAERKLAALRGLVSGTVPTTLPGRNLMSAARRLLDDFEQRILVGRSSLEELATQLSQEPESVDKIQRLGLKTYMEVGKEWQRSPAVAAASFQRASAAFAAGKEAAQSPEAKKAYEAQAGMLARCEQDIERGKGLAELIGTDSIPLEADQWLNGTPLKPEDLRGKVVLLDFWAVWCGPCVATFPHLRDWQAKYGPQGLVIVGLTNYYGYRWDAEKARAVTGEEVKAEEEHAMLTAFASHHQLAHRLAVVKEPVVAKHYRVRGIPQVVLLDQQGKVRLIRVGAGTENAKQIEQVLAELLASNTEPAAAK